MKLNRWSRLLLVLFIFWGAVIVVGSGYLIFDNQGAPDRIRTYRIGDEMSSLKKTVEVHELIMRAKGDHSSWPVPFAESNRWHFLRDFKKLSPEQLSSVLTDNFQDDPEMAKVQREFESARKDVFRRNLRIAGWATIAWLLPITLLYVLGRTAKWVWTGRT